MGTYNIKKYFFILLLFFLYLICLSIRPITKLLLFSIIIIIFIIYGINFKVYKNINLNLIPQLILLIYINLEIPNNNEMRYNI